ncbi:neo-calmodulin-like [Corticium candelabrum]|uniref:neo-calmodulin-like n=1 Tax=Corticium candelabrum TaxID=121492 RepID=UPI002E26AEB2|nr:neo-calmodulin-like [Corticium candelabrum]
MTDVRAETVTSEQEQGIDDTDEMSMTEASMRQVFMLFDKDESGTISTDELKSVFKSLGQNPNMAELQAMISEVDSDGNGEIDFHEFSAMMAKYMKSSDDDYIEQVKEAFKIMDMDQNGFIEPQELKEVMTRFGQRLSDVDVEDMIREADMDGDGRVNFDEFEVLMMNSKEQLAL